MKKSNKKVNSECNPTKQNIFRVNINKNNLIEKEAEPEPEKKKEKVMRGKGRGVLTENFIHSTK